MLLEFSCSNHKSFKDKIVFSTVAGKDNTFEDRLMKCGKYRVSKISAIYGANGSGKSNFIDAIQFMKLLVINSINHQPGDEIRQQPHKLLSFDVPSEYSVQFVVNGIIYAYGFALQNKLVVDEYLFYFPNGRQKKIFERTADDYIPGDSFKNKFDSCKDVIKPNRLFLSCAANFSAVQEIETVFNFFKEELVIYRGFGLDNWRQYSLNRIHDDSRVKAAVLTFLKSLDTGINDIVVDIQETNMSVDEIDPYMPKELKALLANHPISKIDTFIHYDKFSVRIEEESTGIQKLIEFLCPLIDLLKTENKSQIIFTTHDTNILDLNIFRRDQIWFTELKKESRSTDMYSLVEMKSVRKDENIAKGYISGKYGAIPMLNKDMASFIDKLQHEE